MARIFHILLLLLAFDVGIVSAQTVEDNRHQITVTGKVVSATDDEPLIAATVLYRNSANGKYLPKVVTDYDGRFELDFVPQDTLMVKLIGYKTQKFMPTDDPILIRVEEDSTEVFGCPKIVVYPVSGEVLDEKGVPITGAAIKVKDTYKDVTTGLNGEFEIFVQKDDVLEITCPGYKTQTKKASIKKPMKIKLKPTRK